tara:strand:+ start:86 stop:397 length:312 start_codon:yes stop_codon:yes gene_type:complete
MNLGENPALTEEVKSDNELKTWLVNYVGEKMNPEDDQVTVEMVIETLSEDFPEFLMAFAEENWIRGYHQALCDVEEGEKMLKEDNNKKCDGGNCGSCECEEDG